MKIKYWQDEYVRLNALVNTDLCAFTDVMKREKARKMDRGERGGEREREIVDTIDVQIYRWIDD